MKSHNSGWDLCRRACDGQVEALYAAGVRCMVGLVERGRGDQGAAVWSVDEVSRADL
jgi:hypothetical protein